MDHLDALRARQLDARLWAVAFVEAVAATDLPGMDALVLDMLEPQPREDRFRGALVALTWLLQDALDEGHLDPAEWLAEQRGRALADQPPGAEPVA